MSRRSPATEVGLRLIVVAGFIAGVVPTRAVSAAEPPGEVVSFADLPGFAADDLRVPWRLFLASCAVRSRPLRVAVPSLPELRAVCAAAKAVKLRRPAAVRAFFEQHFTPLRVSASAFFTGYYEPVVAGSLAATRQFATPLLAAPPGLVTLQPGTTPQLDPALTAARRLPDGRLVALPDRAGIETGGLGPAARPLVYVGSPAEAFFIHVQGSARIQLPNGKLRRLVFAGRNGYPYTSIGKILVARLNIPPSAMGMAELKAWLHNNGEGAGDAGTMLMRENRSFIFFRFDDALPASAGPIGGEGLSLTPLRSIAIDRNIWPYGLPFYVDTSLPDTTPFRRLMVGQDTGSAILGPARADIFFGTGDEAARRSGAVRQPGTLFVLWPKPMPVEKPRAKTRGASR